MTLPETLAREAAKEIQLAALRDGCLNGTKLIDAVEVAIRKAIEACADRAHVAWMDGIPVAEINKRIRNLLTEEETP